MAGETDRGELATAPIPLRLKLVALVAAHDREELWPLVIDAGVATNELIVGAGVAEPGLIVSTSITDPVPPLLVAVTVTLETPATVGVPESRPLALSDSPGGNPAALNVGEFDAWNWSDRGTPTVPTNDVMNTGGGTVA